MISALWANSNFDDDKGTRRNAIEEIEANFEEVVQSILNPQEAEDDEIDKDNPFFAAAEKGKSKLFAENPDGTVKEAIDYEKSIDQ